MTRKIIQATYSQKASGIGAREHDDEGNVIQFTKNGKLMRVRIRSNDSLGPLPCSQMCISTFPLTKIDIFSVPKLE